MPDCKPIFESSNLDKEAFLSLLTPEAKAAWKRDGFYGGFLDGLESSSAVISV